jgi:amino acid transporter
MVSFKETKGKVVFGLTIVLIILFLLFAFLFYITKIIDDVKESVFTFMAVFGVITFFLSLALSIVNNKYRNDKELSDSNRMDDALSGIPIFICVSTFIIGGLSISMSDSAPKPSGPPLRLGDGSRA